MRAPKGRMTVDQLRRLHAVGAELGMNHDDLHDEALARHPGIGSIRHLTGAQAALWIADLEARAQVQRIAVMGTEAARERLAIGGRA